MRARRFRRPIENELSPIANLYTGKDFHERGHVVQLDTHQQGVNLEHIMLGSIVPCPNCVSKKLLHCNENSCLS